MIFNKFKNLIFLLFFLFAPTFVLAQGDGYNFLGDSGLNIAAEKTGHTKGSKIFKNSDDISASIGLIIQVLISFIGVIFMILLVYGGILWMTAAGNDQQVDKAKKIIVESMIGLVIVVSAYAISILVIESFSFQ